MSGDDLDHPDFLAIGPGDMLFLTSQPCSLLLAQAMLLA